jgi:hypothetical protein
MHSSTSSEGFFAFCVVGQRFSALPRATIKFQIGSGWQVPDVLPQLSMECLREEFE